MIYTRKTLSIVVLIFLLPLVAHAQKQVDSVQLLDAAMVKAKHQVGTSAASKFSLGAQAMVADSTVLSRHATQSLNNFISTYTPAFVRENASNGSTISLRGTGASHTTVSWNGVNITPATMGQINLKRFPLFFTDEVQVHAGGEGAVYGSGSIGGSLDLKSEAVAGDGFGLLLQQSAGSFGTLFSGVKVRFGEKKLQAKTSVLYGRSDNDFKFKNTAKEGGPVEKQANAAYKNVGLQQELYAQLSEKSTLSSQIRYMDMRNDMQLAMTENPLGTGYNDNTKDRQLHALLTYNRNAGFARLTATGGYLYDHQLYTYKRNKYESLVQEDRIATNRIVGVVEAERLFFSLVRLKLGVSSDYIIPHTSAYKSGVKEWRRDAYINALFLISRRAEVSVGMRQSFVTDLSVPFTPAAGVSYMLLSSSNHMLKLRAGYARNIRVPSLNDRYWKALDANGKEGKERENLKPEKSTNLEAGMSYVLSVSGEPLAAAEIVAYQNMVSNWIIWIPRGHIWKPENYQKVCSSGIEAVVSINRRLGELAIGGQVMYAFTRSIIKEGMYNNDPRKGMQLTFQPRHKGTAAVSTGYKGCTMEVRMSYVGERSGTDRNRVAQSYFLTNLLVEKQLVVSKKHALTISVELCNLFDIAYESIPFFAMPGRAWNAGIRYTFR